MEIRDLQMPFITCELCIFIEIVGLVMLSSRNKLYHWEFTVRQKHLKTKRSKTILKVMKRTLLNITGGPTYNLDLVAQDLINLL